MSEQSESTELNEDEILNSFAVPPRVGRFKSILNWMIREPFGTLGALLIFTMLKDFQKKITNLLSVILIIKKKLKKFLINIARLEFLILLQKHTLIDL